MKVLNFTYTREDGKITERSFVPITIPSDKYFGIDISDTDAESSLEFITKLSALREDEKVKVANLMAEYDLKHNFRQFFEDKMTNVTAEIY